MKPNILSLSTIMLMFSLLLHAPIAQAYIRDLCFNPLGLARIDPIVSPGKASAHAHHLHGSGNLGINSTDADYLLEANCTSCSITVDKSGYWAPAMYFQHENGTFEPLTISSAITVYYKFEKRVNFENQNYTVFPKGFRMITGNTTKRTWDSPWPIPEQSIWGPADLTQEALTEKSIGFNCMNYNAAAEATFEYPWIRNKTFVDAHCTQGLRAEILFPSCWDGKNLDSPNHKAHVAFPTLKQDGGCPETHPVYLPIIFYETIWNTQNFAGVPGQFVMSNGDPTGFGYHADFLAAWEDGFLQAMANDETCTDHDLSHRVSSGLQEECPVIAKYLQSQELAAECVVQLPDVLKHDAVQGLLTELPGEVPVTGVRHDPGTHENDGSASNITSSVPAPVVSATSNLSKPVTSSLYSETPFPSMTASDITSTSVVTPTATILATSMYTTDGTYVELIIAQAVVTTTVTATDDGHLAARHGHSHRSHV